MKIDWQLPLVLVAISLFTGCSSQPAAENPPPPDSLPELASVEPAITEQARGAFRRSCAQCHGYDARGIAAVAPDLRRAKRRSAEEWERYLRDSSGSHPAGRPPPLWIDGDELTAIAAYLDSLSQQNP